MDLQIKDSKETISVSDKIFDTEYNEGLIHHVITSFLSNARQANSFKKNRSMVRGGGAKPWRQKGTGRARAGTIRSPLWRSGGVTFGGQRANYTKKINKKMYSKAICSIISELYRLGRLVVVKDFTVNSVKTKEFKQYINNNFDVASALIIKDHVDENEYLASRNLIKFDVCDTIAIDPVVLLMHENVIITEAAIAQLEGQIK